MELTENQKLWLNALFDDAIEEAYATADNEHTWADGSPDVETKEMHKANAAEQLVYAERLEELKDKIDFL